MVNKWLFTGIIIILILYLYFSDKFPKLEIPEINKVIINEEISLDVTNVEVDNECLTSGIKNYPCYVAKITIENNMDKSTTVLLKTYGLVTKTGKQYGIYTSLSVLPYMLKREDCYEPLKHFGGDTILPHAKIEYTLCFPLINLKEEPKVYISILYDYRIKTTEGEIEYLEGKERSFSFLLSKFLG